MGKRIVERPRSVAAADMMELPLSKGQYKYILVFQDLFTRWIELKPLRKADGKAVAKALEELIFFRWETPEYFLTDNGKEFDNQTLKEVLEESGVRHITTPPYHPQSNPVERSNRIIKTMIATFVSGDHRSWDAHLHEFRHAINTAIQSSLKTSPAFLNYGRQPRPEDNRGYGRQPRPVRSLRREVEDKQPVLKLDPEIWIDRMKRLQALRELVAKNIDDSSEKQKNYYNRGKRVAVYQVAIGLCGDCTYSPTRHNVFPRNLLRNTTGRLK